MSASAFILSLSHLRYCAYTPTRLGTAQYRAVPPAFTSPGGVLGASSRLVFVAVGLIEGGQERERLFRQILEEDKLRPSGLTRYMVAGLAVLTAGYPHSLLHKNFDHWVAWTRGSCLRREWP